MILSGTHKSSRNEVEEVPPADVRAIAVLSHWQFFHMRPTLRKNFWVCERQGNGCKRPIFTKRGWKRNNASFTVAVVHAWSYMLPTERKKGMFLHSPVVKSQCLIHCCILLDNLLSLFGRPRSQRWKFKRVKGRTWSDSKTDPALNYSPSFRHSSKPAVDGSKDEVQRDCERWQWLVPIGTNSLKDNLWLKIPLYNSWVSNLLQRRLHWKKLRAGVLQWDWWHFTEWNFQWKTFPRHIEDTQMEVREVVWHYQRFRDHERLIFNGFLLCFPFAVSRCFKDFPPCLFGQKPIIFQSLYFTVRI